MQKRTYINKKNNKALYKTLSHLTLSDSHNTTRFKQTVYHTYESADVRLNSPDMENVNAAQKKPKKTLTPKCKYFTFHQNNYEISRKILYVDNCTEIIQLLMLCIKYYYQQGLVNRNG